LETLINRGNLNKFMKVNERTFKEKIALKTIEYKLAPFDPFIKYGKTISSKKGIAEATGVNIALTTPYAILERLKIDFPFIDSLDKVPMDTADSIDARIKGALLAYLGIGAATGILREKWNGWLHQNNYLSNTSQPKKDSLFSGMFALGLLPAFYLATGQTDLQVIGGATFFGVITNMTFGGPLGYGIDTCQDLLEVKRRDEEGKTLPQRIPTNLQKATPAWKKTAFVGATAMAIVATAGVYEIADLILDKPTPKPTYTTTTDLPTLEDTFPQVQYE